MKALFDSVDELFELMIVELVVPEIAEMTALMLAELSFVAKKTALASAGLIVLPVAEVPVKVNVHCRPDMTVEKSAEELERVMVVELVAATTRRLVFAEISVAIVVEFLEHVVVEIRLTILVVVARADSLVEIIRRKDGYFEDSPVE